MKMKSFVQSLTECPNRGEGGAPKDRCPPPLYAYVCISAPMGALKVTSLPL